MKIDLTLMVQIEIEAISERDYEIKRDRLITDLELRDFTVDIESEDEADGSEDDE